MAGMHFLTNKGARGKNKRDFCGQVGTGGGQKYWFTVQFSITKDGTKLTPCVMFKSAPFDGNRDHRRWSVANEKHEQSEYSNDNSPPPRK